VPNLYPYGFCLSESGAIRFSRSLDEDAIDILIQCGLQERFPEVCNAWKNSVEQARKLREGKIKQMEVDLKEELESKSAQLRDLLRQSIVDSIVNKFPYVKFVAQHLLF
jgi:hypothetical protein